MKKIYYYKQEVKMGDKVSINDALVTVTPQLIDDFSNRFTTINDTVKEREYVECIKLVGGNSWPKVGEILPVTEPDCNGQQAIQGVCMVGSFAYNNCFKPATKMDWLLQEAERKYPKGTKFKSPAQLGTRIATSTGKFTAWDGCSDGVCTDGMLVYFDNKWAEIVKEPLFITEDGVEIFEGDEYWWIYDKTDDNIMHAELGAHLNSGQREHAIYFSTREKAEEYIRKNKEKTIQDYENILLKSDDIMFSSPINRGYGELTVYTQKAYEWLKKNEPKLFYFKVLQLIAKDLNDGWEPDWNDLNERKYYIFKEFESNKYSIGSYTSTWGQGVVFKSQKITKKAIEIMGHNKLDIIFG